MVYVVGRGGNRRLPSGQRHNSYGVRRLDAALSCEYRHDLLPKDKAQSSSWRSPLLRGVAPRATGPARFKTGGTLALPSGRGSRSGPSSGSSPRSVSVHIFATCIPFRTDKNGLTFRASWGNIRVLRYSNIWRDMTPEQRDFGARMFSALGHPARLCILEFVAQGPASVNEIAEAIGMKQSMTSQHLSALLRAGVLVREAKGNTRVYSLRGPRIAQILYLVEEFYEVHLEGLRQLVGSRGSSD